MKALEAEVVKALKDLGQTDRDILQTGYQVSPHQFRGLDISAIAASIAELVVMISYVQKHYELYGTVYPPEPTVYDYALVERRDALLAWDRVETDDGVKKTPRQAAAWPAADYIIGNPPLIGNKKMRLALGDDYVEALRGVYPDIPASVDFVMFWWHKTAELVRDGRVKRAGLMTTNSIRQTYNRKVVDKFLKDESPISFRLAIPDQPWVGSSGDTQVRISMMVLERGANPGRLMKVISETSGHEYGGFKATYFDTQKGYINPDLSIRADTSNLFPLQSNRDLGMRGAAISGQGFDISQAVAAELGLGRVPGLENHIRLGNDLARQYRGKMVIDLHGLSLEDVQRRYPLVYRWVLEKVKPERAGDKIPSRREKWWLFAASDDNCRKAASGLNRYVATPQTSMHPFFSFLEPSILPDQQLVVFAFDDVYYLGVLSSRIHLAWAWTIGGRMGASNALRYVKTKCFDPFPFPEADESQKERIRALAEQIDLHRKERQKAYPELTLSDMYAVLENLRQPARRPADSV